MSPALSLEPAEVPVAPAWSVGALRVLHADGDRVLAGRGLDLMESTDGGRSFRRRARHDAGALDRTLARTPLAARLLRAGFHGAVPLADGGVVAVVRRAILHLAPGAERFTVAHDVARGTRPLNVCRAPSGRLFFGEYFGNPDRGEVHVYGSDDGRAWEVAHTFPAGAVRHVHGVWPDPYRGGVWVLTGDDDRESGLWFSGDDLVTLDPVVRGSQRARAVVVLPTPDGLVVPMDTPRELNRVQWLDPATGRLEDVAVLPGSVFSGAATAGLLVLSTTVEPSEVNTDPRPALLVSRDGGRWTLVARFRRDLAARGARGGLLQYPTLQLPAGRGGAQVLATGQAIAGRHGRMLGWDEAELLAAVGSGR